MMSEAKTKSKQNNTTKGTEALALAQVKAGNNSENLSNEIRQVIYSLYQSKEITKKVYNNLMKSL